MKASWKHKLQAGIYERRNLAKRLKHYKHCFNEVKKTLEKERKKIK